MSGFRMEMSPRLEQSMKLLIAPKMIQSMEILQLPIMALQERIEQELQENPVLELKEVSEDEVAPGDEDGPALDKAERADEKATEGESQRDPDPTPGRPGM